MIWIADDVIKEEPPTENCLDVLPDKYLKTFGYMLFSSPRASSVVRGEIFGRRGKNNFIATFCCE